MASETPVQLTCLIEGDSTVFLKPENKGVVPQATPELGYDVGGPTRDQTINKFLERLRPEIKGFLSRPRHRVWMPPETVDANTRQFYQNLGIPSIYSKPNLLLHHLGDKTNPNEDFLFQSGVNHRILCNTSGAGKTALIFDGLCSRWGFYFSAAQDSNGIGTKDLQIAIDIMSKSPGWIHNAFKNPLSDAIQEANNVNEAIAFKSVYKVLLTRWILFSAFVDVAKEQHAGNLPPDLKRDWLLFQILPVVLINDIHPFIAFMNQCLVDMSMSDLESRLAKFSPGSVLGPAFDSESDNFFYILDEAQVAGAKYMGAFADPNGEIRRPVLQPIIRAWDTVVPFESIRFIVSGTGFPLDLFKTVLTSRVSKASPSWEVVHQTGDFINRDLQKSYITRYLPPPFLSSPSGTVLVSRMYEWLRGRHRFTATFIEQLLAGAWTSNSPSSPQKLLNAYVRVFTDFNPLDCDSKLLEIEPDVDFPQLNGFAWDKIKQEKDMLKKLSTRIYTYMIRGEYPMWCNEMQDLVEYGVARFKGQGDEVIVEEPMALVGIARYFDKEGFTIDGDIRARMQAAKGVAFEEAVLLSCTRLFRVGARLSDVFRFHGVVPDWADQKGWIVSWKGQGLEVADIVNGSPIVPSVGVAYYAKNPDDVENWINCKSSVWCVPGTLMGPDLMAWLRLEDGRLIHLLIQAKCYPEGNKNTFVPKVTAEAIRSLKFYDSLHRRSAEAKRSRMLELINTDDESFTGSRYNVLRVVAAYPLDDSARSEEIASALRGDQHPLATFRYASLLSSLATHDNTRTALSSLACTFKRARENDEHYPKKRSRRNSV
ncbi:hypothetical protein M378DRAFT_173230 [Amanita muscaria Koide BX008]|uniref:Uncharacterized protein n=1 Tax=Amanita muscaria (strain Koide BX008) TaxID=946122 RepID=A0A0C2WIA0_AMAMK|nr:hypothetical protein M378DRAFT_173230 [Amanita muscaria Koide BX008]